MIIDSGVVTGSLEIQGPLTVTGSITATQGITGSLLGTATTASFVLNAVSSSFSTTASYVANSLTASYVTNALSASLAATASTADNFTVRGTLTAQTIVVQTITSSVDFVTGSTKFGSLLTNTHQFTGSVGITGSLDVNGTINPSNISDTYFPFKSGSVLGQSILRQTSTGSIIFGEDIGPTSPDIRRLTINSKNY